MPNFCQLSTHDFYSKDAMIIFFISIYGQNSIQFNAPKKRLHNRTDTSTYIVDVLWGQPIKLIQVVFTSEFHEY